MVCGKKSLRRQASQPPVPRNVPQEPKYREDRQVGAPDGPPALPLSLGKTRATIRTYLAEDNRYMNGEKREHRTDELKSNPAPPWPEQSKAASNCCDLAD